MVCYQLVKRTIKGIIFRPLYRIPIFVLHFTEKIEDWTIPFLFLERTTIWLTPLSWLGHRPTKRWGETGTRSLLAVGERDRSIVTVEIQRFDTVITLFYRKSSWRCTEVVWPYIKKHNPFYQDRQESCPQAFRISIKLKELFPPFYRK